MVNRTPAARGVIDSANSYWPQDRLPLGDAMLIRGSYLSLLASSLLALAALLLAACIPEPYEGTKDAPPARPTGVTVSAGDGSVTLSWNPASRAEGYNLYWDITAGVSRETGTPISAVSSPYVHSGLSNGRSYYYVVTSWNANGESAESAQVGATPQAASTAPTPEPGSPQAPSAPTGFTATAGSGQVTLTWTAVSNATGYNTYWSTTTGVTRSTGTKIGSISSPYTHSGLTNGTTYHYVVTTLSAGGESAESVPVSATPKALTTSSCTAPGGCWATKASMPTARGDTAGSVVNGKIYVIGGHSGTSGLSTVEVYDPVNNSWSTKAPMTTPRVGPTSSQVNGKIYVFGGYIGGSILNTTEEYDPFTDSWSARKPLSATRSYATSSEVNGRIYVIGGSDGSVYLNTVEQYDPATDTWTTKAPMPTARMGAASSVVNGKIYVFGGYNGSTRLRVVEEYDPITDAWTTKSPMSTARQSPTSGNVNGKFYVVGGHDGSSYLNTMEQYDPVTDTWGSSASMPSARAVMTGAVVNGVIYVIGGNGSGGTPLNTVEAYTPPAP
jgi:N-acetylneuraminic acid mutarotase